MILSDFLGFGHSHEHCEEVKKERKKEKEANYEKTQEATYQQTSKHSFRRPMGQQIKPIQRSAFRLPRRYAGRVTALQQLAEPIASPRKTKTTQTLSLIY